MGPAPTLAARPHALALALRACVHGCLQGRREEGLTGVWVDGAKVAAIGVRARK